MIRNKFSLFLYLDGVLADFDAGYHQATGTRSSIEADNVDWQLVAAHGSFYRTLPLMDGATELVNAVLRRVHAHDLDRLPTILTGCPRSVPEAADQKREWVAEHFPGLSIITCKSREKSKHAKPGDVIIDDWPKYRSLWTTMGGHWITHTGVAESLAELDALIRTAA